VNRTSKWIVAGAVTVAAVGGGAGIAAAGGGEDGGSDKPITGDALDRASAVALEHTGGGRVTGTEVDDEESYYEVEVTLDDGSQVDVQLDRDLNVVDQMADSENDE
jgi:uncharacterized membrane protein YkoI